MNKTQLIFLLGTSHCGKDTIGKVFIKYGYQRLGFADIVKQEVADHYKISVEELYEQGPVKEKWRPIIIEWAEEKRAIDQSYWINKTFKPFLDEKNAFKEGLKLIVTDIRRTGEIDWIFEYKKMIKELNAFSLELKHYVDVKLFYIHRETNDQDILTHKAIGYALGINKIHQHFIDSIIENDKDIELLDNKVVNIIENFNLN